MPHGAAEKKKKSPQLPRVSQDFNPGLLVPKPERLSIELSARCQDRKEQLCSGPHQSSKAPQVQAQWGL